VPEKTHAVPLGSALVFSTTTPLKLFYFSGMLYIHRGEDSLIHFCWKDRTTGTTEPNDDLLIFPDEAEFMPVPQCTTGRVFVLKWKNNDNRRFFWMQEPEKNKDKVC
jgi:26S proteasome regulatory subunit N13